MSKTDRQTFTGAWANLTTLGKPFGLSATAMGRKLKALGLRCEDGYPTKRAFVDGYCIPTPLKDGTSFFMWNKQKTGALMRAHGHQGLDPQHIEADDLADRWEHVHKQWQEALSGVVEELLMEEAQVIAKEIRRRGLTEHVNALLRARNFDGDFIT